MDKFKDLLFEEKERLTVILKAVDALIEAYKEPLPKLVLGGTTTGELSMGSVKGGSGTSKYSSGITVGKIPPFQTLKDQVYFVISNYKGVLSLKEIKDRLSSHGIKNIKSTAPYLIILLKEKKIKRSGTRRKYKYFT